MSSRRRGSRFRAPALSSASELESLGLEQPDVVQQLLERPPPAYVHLACVVVAQLEAAAQILRKVGGCCG